MHRHLLVLVTLLAALTAALAVPAPPEADEVYVVMAARQLHPGVPISVDDLYAVAVRSDLVSEGMFVSPVHVVNRIPHERILVNEIVRQERLALAAEGQGLAVLVPRGARGMVFALPTALTPFVHPGALVDLLVHTADGVELVAEQAPVVGIGPDAVVLAIAAQNVPAVHDAMQRGTMHVSLRRHLDVHPVPQVDRLRDAVRSRVKVGEVQRWLGCRPVVRREFNFTCGNALQGAPRLVRQEPTCQGLW